MTTPTSKSQETNAIVDRWFTEFWGKSWNPSVVDELCAPHMLLQYLLQAPHRGRADVKTFMTELREAFPDMSAAPIANLTVEGDYVVGRWEAEARTQVLPTVTFLSDPFQRPLAKSCG